MKRMNLAALFFGSCFGFLFNAGGFNQYNVIHRMLLLQRFDPFLVMGSAVLTALPLLWLLERRKTSTVLAGPLELRRWKPESKHVFGGLVFGTGWAVTGACPGTISGMLAVGSLLGLVPLSGILTGMYMRDLVVERRTAEEPGPAPADAVV